MPKVASTFTGNNEKTVYQPLSLLPQTAQEMAPGSFHVASSTESLSDTKREASSLVDVTSTNNHVPVTTTNDGSDANNSNSVINKTQPPSLSFHFRQPLMKPNSFHDESTHKQVRSYASDDLPNSAKHNHRNQLERRSSGTFTKSTDQGPAHNPQGVSSSPSPSKPVSRFSWVKRLVTRGASSRGLGHNLTNTNSNSGRGGSGNGQGPRVGAWAPVRSNRPRIPNTNTELEFLKKSASSIKNKRPAVPTGHTTTVNRPRHVHNSSRSHTHHYHGSGNRSRSRPHSQTNYNYEESQAESIRSDPRSTENLMLTPPPDEENASKEHGDKSPVMEETLRYQGFNTPEEYYEAISVTDDMSRHPYGPAHRARSFVPKSRHRSLMSPVSSVTSISTMSPTSTVSRAFTYSHRDNTDDERNSRAEEEEEEADLFPKALVQRPHVSGPETNSIRGTYEGHEGHGNPQAYFGLGDEDDSSDTARDSSGESDGTENEDGEQPPEALLSSDAPEPSRQLDKTTTRSSAASVLSYPTSLYDRTEERAGLANHLLAQVSMHEGLATVRAPSLHSNSHGLFGLISGGLFGSNTGGGASTGPQDTASVVTLASSTRQLQRQSFDTNASTRAIAPESLRSRNSLESLPLTAAATVLSYATSASATSAGNASSHAGLSSVVTRDSDCSSSGPDGADSQRAGYEYSTEIEFSGVASSSASTSAMYCQSAKTSARSSVATFGTGSRDNVDEEKTSEDAEYCDGSDGTDNEGGIFVKKTRSKAEDGSDNGAGSGSRNSSLIPCISSINSPVPAESPVGSVGGPGPGPFTRALALSSTTSSVYSCDLDSDVDISAMDINDYEDESTGGKYDDLDGSCSGSEGNTAVSNVQSSDKSRKKREKGKIRKQQSGARSSGSISRCPSAKRPARARDLDVPHADNASMVVLRDQDDRHRHRRRRYRDYRAHRGALLRQRRRNQFNGQSGPTSSISSQAD